MQSTRARARGRSGTRGRQVDPSRHSSGSIRDRGGAVRVSVSRLAWTGTIGASRRGTARNYSESSGGRTRPSMRQRQIQLSAHLRNGAPLGIGNFFTQGLEGDHLLLEKIDKNHSNVGTIACGRARKPSHRSILRTLGTLARWSKPEYQTTVREQAPALKVAAKCH